MPYLQGVLPTLEGRVRQLCWANLHGTTCLTVILGMPLLSVLLPDSVPDKLTSLSPFSECVTPRSRSTGDVETSQFCHQLANRRDVASFVRATIFRTMDPSLPPPRPPPPPAPRVLTSRSGLLQENFCLKGSSLTKNLESPWIVHAWLTKYEADLFLVWVGPRNLTHQELMEACLLEAEAGNPFPATKSQGVEKSACEP